MPEIKEKESNREPGLCVIRDDDHDWGGPTEILPEEKKKEKKIDEPMNWPFNRYRL